MIHEIRRAFHRHGPGHGFRAAWGLGHGREWGGLRGGWVQPIRRGEVKFVVLDVLAAGPKHGYEVMSAIEERRNVRPSAGSIYPTLQMLEDGGFITSADVEGKKVYTITESGRALLADRDVEPDGTRGDGDEAHELLRQSLMKFVNAVVNARHTDPATMQRIRETIDRGRKEIYTILASDES